MRLGDHTLVAVIAMFLIGCNGESDDPLSVAPFDVSRVGESVTIPVKVTEDNTDLSVTYAVGVFLWDSDHDGRLDGLRTYPPLDRLYLRVRVWRVVDGICEAVEINDRDFAYDIKTKQFTFPPSMSERKTDVAYVSASGRRGDVVYMDSAHFKFPAYGDYLFEVATVHDMPMLRSIPAWLTVQRDFPHGK